MRFVPLSTNRTDFRDIFHKICSVTWVFYFFIHLFHRAVSGQLIHVRKFSLSKKFNKKNHRRLPICWYLHIYIT